MRFEGVQIIQRNSQNIGEVHCRDFNVVDKNVSVQSVHLRRTVSE